MDAREVREFMRTSMLRQRKAEQDVVVIARSLPPMLRDRGMVETAKELERALFVVASIEAEMTETTRANLDSFLEAITGRFGDE